jgi:hypothetical protein
MNLKSNWFNYLFTFWDKKNQNIQCNCESKCYLSNYISDITYEFLK